MKQPIMILFFLLCVSNFSVRTQTIMQGAEKLPVVFQIGAYEGQYEEMVKEYPINLLSVCNDSMDLAYEKWMYLLLEMEEYSEATRFDLKGLKIWMNVFWNRDGTIDHISYYPKPNCRNIPFGELTEFLEGFVGQYSSRIDAVENFNHYGSAIFPSFAKMFLPEK